MAPQNRTVALDALVVTTAQRNSGVSWPLAVDHRLDELLRIAREHGLNTTRKELVAAIVATIQLEPDDMDEMLKRYRRSRVRQILITSTADEEKVITFPRQRSGPRRLEGGGIPNDRGN